MNGSAVIRRFAKSLPDFVVSPARRIYYLQRHWAHEGLKGTGSVQDLYYWVSNHELDTMLLLQNYFSVFYPDLDTHTTGVIRLFDSDGIAFAEVNLELGKFESVKVMISSILNDCGRGIDKKFGTLECHLAIPKSVMEAAEGDYFFDRFYIGYKTKLGQPAFVHGVDRTHIYREDKPRATLWYKAAREHHWAPEIPINIDEYQGIKVIMINRTGTASTTTLTVFDRNDKFKKWNAVIKPGGVHQFELNSSMVNGLDPIELRLQVGGMATQIGRPVVFKEFHNGTISVMHC